MSEQEVAYALGEGDGEALSEEGRNLEEGLLDGIEHEGDVDGADEASTWYP